MGVGVFARLQRTPGIRQWDPRTENWVPTCTSIWDQDPRLGLVLLVRGPDLSSLPWGTGALFAVWADA
jgi:hypothetical protein